MKRIISVVLATCMMMATLVFANEASQPNEAFSMSIELLLKLNIVKDVTKTDYTNPVTRAEFAEMVAAVVFPDKNYYYARDREYEDVDWEYQQMVNALTDQNIMLGYEDNTFKLQQSITYQEALKTLVSLTGYDYHAALAGGYPVGYVSTAKRIGLLKDFPDSGEHAINLGEAALLVCNALKADTVTMTVQQDKVSYQIEKGVNLLGKNFKAFEGKGVISATEDTDLYGGVNAPKGSIIINDESYAADASLKKYIGYMVKFYYIEDSVSDARIIIVQPDEKNEVLKLKSEEIQDFADRKYTYCLDTDLKNKTARISDLASVLYNYRIPENRKGEALYWPDEGVVELIDHDGDKVYDVILVWNYEVYIVNSVSPSQYNITDMYGKDMLNLDPYKTNCRIIKNDSEIPLSKLEKWNVLSVAVSDSKDELVTVTVSDTRVSGYVQGYDRDYVTIAGEEYRLSKVFSKKQITGDTLDFYLDFMGRAVIYDIDSSSGQTRYGVLCGWRMDDLSDDPPELRIFNENGEFVYYKMRKKVEIDAIKHKDTRDLFTSESANALYDANRGIIAQMLAFKTNTNNEIIFIDTTIREAGEDETSFNKSEYQEKGQYMLLGHSWKDQYVLNIATQIFMVPGDKEGNILRGLEYEKYYSVKSYKVWNDPFKDHYNYRVQFFNVNQANVTDLMINFKDVGKLDSSDFGQDPFLWVKSIDHRVNEDNMVELCITGWCKGEYVTYACDSEVYQEVEKLKKGDIIQYLWGAQDKINAINVLYDGTQKYFLTNTYHVSKRVLYGQITAVDTDSNVIKVTYTYNSDGTVNLNSGIPNLLKGESGNGGVTMRYNVKTGKLEPAGWSDLVVGKSVILDKNETATRAVILID